MKDLLTIFYIKKTDFRMKLKLKSGFILTAFEITSLKGTS